MYENNNIESLNPSDLSPCCLDNGPTVTEMSLLNHNFTGEPCLLIHNVRSSVYQTGMLGFIGGGGGGRENNGFPFFKFARIPEST